MMMMVQHHIMTSRHHSRAVAFLSRLTVNLRHGHHGCGSPDLRRQRVTSHCPVLNLAFVWRSWKFRKFKSHRIFLKLVKCRENFSAENCLLHIFLYAFPHVGLGWITVSVWLTHFPGGTQRWIKQHTVTLSLRTWLWCDSVFRPVTLTVWLCSRQWSWVTFGCQWWRQSHSAASRRLSFELVNLLRFIPIVMNSGPVSKCLLHMSTGSWKYSKNLPFSRKLKVIANGQGPWKFWNVIFVWSIVELYCINQGSSVDALTIK